MMEKYFRSYWPALGLDQDAFLKLGVHPEKPEAGFNMTVLAFRLSKYRKGVSKKHGEVSRRMWQSLWAEFPEGESAIDHITNGVHLPTWIEPKMQLLLNKYLGPGWMADHDNPLIWDLIDKIPDEEIWKTHYWLKIKLIDAIRERARLRWAEDRVNPSSVEDYGEQLAQYLVHGADVWLNNPVPPMEASGTSGMKAAVNGVPQLSIMDGWWIEGFNGKNGWAIDYKESDANRDQVDTAEIYRTLEDKIIPLYYKVSEEVIPNEWVGVMKEAIKGAAVKFASRRMVKEYVEKFYANALRNL
jgi:glucan phosphorylase